MRVGLDLGFGRVKGVTDRGRRIEFPSALAWLPSPGLQAPELSGLEHMVTLAVGNEAARVCLVGDGALRSALGARAWCFDPRQGIEELQALLLTSLALLGAGGEDVELALGLPLGPASLHCQGLSSLLGGLEGQVTIQGQPPCRVRLAAEVLVMPEGLGALLSEVRRGGLGGSEVAVVDIGYRTTDFLVAGPGPQGLRHRPDLSGTLDLGYGQVVVQVAAQLAARLGGVRPDILRVEHALAEGGGRLALGGLSLDLAEDAAVAEAHLARRLTYRLRQIWGEHLDRLDAVLVAGGGGQALFTELAPLHPAARLVAEPSFGNALGYLYALQARGSAPPAAGDLRVAAREESSEESSEVPGTGEEGPWRWPSGNRAG